MSREMLERPLDTTVEVVTPENVAFEYQLAGVARRASAFLLDFFIRLAFLVVLLIVFLTTGLAELAGGQLFVAVMLLALFASEWFYGGVLESYWNGQTIGKWMQGIRVIRTNGQPINGLQAVLRNFLRLVDMMPLLPVGALMAEDPEMSALTIPSCLFCLGSMMLTRRMQRLGDIVCDTMVVLEQPEGAQALHRVDLEGALAIADRLPADLHVTRQQSRAISNFVARRQAFTDRHRAALAGPLARLLARRWSQPDPPDPDLFLCAVYHCVYLADDQQPARASSSAAGAEPTDESAEATREMGVAAR